MQEIAAQRPTISSKLSLISNAEGTLFGHCQECACRKFCAASSLNSYQKTPLFRSHKVPKQQYIFYAGDKLTTLYVVKSGEFKTYLNSESGEEQVMGFYTSGDVLGSDALSDRRHSLSAVALVDSTVCAVTINKLEAIVNEHEPDWLISQVYKVLLRERHTLQINARKHSTDARVALFLLDMAARNKARGYSNLEFKLNIPHRDIAYHLDMAQETISRVFTRLQNQGIICMNRSYIAIQKPEELLALTDMSL